MICRPLGFPVNPSSLINTFKQGRSHQVWLKQFPLWNDIIKRAWGGAPYNIGGGLGMDYVISN
jgi:hypothetical protein